MTDGGMIMVVDMETIRGKPTNNTREAIYHDLNRILYLVLSWVDDDQI